MGLEYVFQKESIVGGLNRVGEIAGREKKCVGQQDNVFQQVMLSLYI